MPWKYYKSKRQLKKYYLSIIPKIRKEARRCGYAIGVHGSLTRDLDLIAVPWVAKYKDPEYLAKSISKKVSGFKISLASFTDKPNGRKACIIPLGINAIIDLSVVPYKK